MFAAIWEEGILQFTVSFLNEDGLSSLSTFWEAASRSDVFKDHPALKEPHGVLATLVPILLFYDGADIYRDKEFFWFIWSSAVSSGSALPKTHKN